ncbi:cyclic nucleotide-binding domain-containing protein [Xanthomonas arboricola]|uniref:cyclic nucleotide-binding domain-containing protein n=1 Tax=Xanthomonas arboricola TaxID=56448 RepID=UPI00398BEA52
MFGILSGAVRVSLEPMQLSERLSLVLGPGQWFGEVPLLDARARAFSAVAHGRSKIAVVSTVAFNRGDRIQPGSAAGHHPPGVLTLSADPELD